MSNDVAGRMLGWSLGAVAGEHRRIHQLVKFPCEFVFKAVGRALPLDDTPGASAASDAPDGDARDDAGFVATLLERVARVLGRAVTDEEHSVRKSARGTYESVTLSLWMTSGDEVYAVYAALGDDERVKYLL